MAEDKYIRWIQRLNNYRKALNRLTQAVRIVAGQMGSEEEIDDLLKEGLIQRFEYTHELAVKVMKDYAECQGYTDIRGSRDAIRKAFEYSQKGIGLSFVEIVSTCNSGWKKSPVDANKWMVEHMFAKYPIGDIKDVLNDK